MKTPRGFTLIELLVVISIIGLLASIVLTSLSSARAKARDAVRQASLKQLQSALELYATSNNGLYPATFNHGGGPVAADFYTTCVSGFFGGSKTLTGASGYIPNLAPTYIGVLPQDTSGSCSYQYVSNGTDYLVMAYGTVEAATQAANSMKRPLQNGSLTPCNVNLVYEADFALYTNGAMCW